MVRTAVLGLLLPSFVVVLLACEGATPAPVAPQPYASAAPPASTPPPAPVCAAGKLSCHGAAVERCNAAGAASEEVQRCEGAACAVTKRGPTCAACDPASVPTCKDDHTIATCKDDGTVETTDCATQQKRCLNGTCADRVCTPGQKHCHNGNLYLCNMTGSARQLVDDCLDGKPNVTRVCQEGIKPAACRTTCKAPVGVTTVIHQEECSCPWEDVPFCAEESAESGCGTRLCVGGPGGGFGVGATMLPCYRETTGLVVPGSEQRGACVGAGEVGTTTITYEVCQGGKPVKATRTAPCVK